LPTFLHVAVKVNEFQAMPGPKKRASGAKPMRRRSFLGPGGQAVLSPIKGFFDVGVSRASRDRAPERPAPF
jgi:hypothetical protein